MTIRTPYDFPLDPETNPLGEKQVSVADPLGSAPGARTYYLARRFTFTEGQYTFLVAADDAATVWIGTNQFDQRIIATPTLGVPATVDVTLATGEYRIDVTLVNLPVEPTPCYFQMVIMRGDQVVYTSAKEGWLLDDIAISDDDLPPTSDVRYMLPVWSVLPNWQGGITESLSWMTDVMASETDAEQRRSVRRNARRSFEASFLRQREAAARMDAFFVGVGPSAFLMPLWHEQVSMLDGIDMAGGGVNFADGELRLREFRKGDIVFVNNGDPNDYDLLEVGDVEQNRFSWKTPPARSWPAKTRIYPMRLARIEPNDARVSGITDGVRRAQVRFTLVEPYYIEPSWGAQVSGQPFFPFAVDRATPVDMEYTRKAYVMDNGSGQPRITDHGRYTSVVVQTRLRLMGRATAYRFRQFIQSARGMARHFFAPTYMQDIYPVSDIASGTREVKIEPQGFRKSMISPQPVRLQLAFQYRDGTPTIYATVADVLETRIGNKLVAETLVMVDPLPAITLSDLKRISFVCETRFEQDSFEIYHPTNGQVVIDVACVLRQASNPRKLPA